MKIFITIQLNTTEFNAEKNLRLLQMKEIFYKYNYSVISDKLEKRLELLALEISLSNQDTIAFNACYTLDDVLYLNNELNKYNLLLDTVFIPSTVRIELRKQEAIRNAKQHSRWLGSDENEVAKSFIDFIETLQHIKEALQNESINVVEC
jgi:hypothetical protein